MPKTWSRSQGGVLPGARDAPRLQDVAQQATILTVTEGGATFELDATPGHAYGPAPWGLGSYATVAAAIAAGWNPQPGDRCLVVFAGDGLTTPWVLAWTR